MLQNQDIKQKQCCNMFNKDLKKKKSISSSVLLEDAHISSTWIMF